MEYYEEIKRKHQQGLLCEEQDNRTLKEIIDLWYQGKGCELVNGEIVKMCLYNIADTLGNIEARKMSPKLYNAYKTSKRLQKINGKRVVADSTLNVYLVQLKSVFNYLINIDEIQYPNPLSKAHRIKTQEPELTYLTAEQIERLLNAIESQMKNKHLLLVTKLCLSTGARWSEIASRKAHHFKNQRVELTKTKGKKIRSIPLDSALYEEARTHLEEHESFQCSLCSFGRALKKANITLPEGEASHVLRHTFASHFMMNKGNIIVLQNILGHADIQLTMKYAKFDLDHFKDAITLNPLSQLARQ